MLLFKSQYRLVFSVILFTITFFCFKNYNNSFLNSQILVTAIFFLLHSIQLILIYKLYCRFKFESHLIYIYLSIISSAANDFIWALLKINFSGTLNTWFIILDIFAFCLWNIFIIVYLIKSFKINIKALKAHPYLLTAFICITIVVCITLEEMIFYNTPKIDWTSYADIIVIIIAVVSIEVLLASLVFYNTDWILIFVVGMLLMHSGSFFAVFNFTRYADFYSGSLIWGFGLILISNALYDLLISISFIKPFVIKNTIQQSLTVNLLIASVLSIIPVFILLTFNHVLTSDGLLYIPVGLTISTIVMLFFLKIALKDLSINFNQLINIIKNFKHQVNLDNVTFSSKEFQYLHHFIYYSLTSIKKLDEERINLAKINFEHELQNIQEKNNVTQLLLKQKNIKEIAYKNKQFIDRISTLVHDIKTPSTLIKQIIHDNKSNVLLSEDVLAIELANYKINNLVQALLYEYKEYKSHEEKIYFNAYLIIKNIINTFRADYPNTLIEDNLEINSISTILFGNIDQFERMIANLINNAVAAISNKNNGFVSIILSEDSEHLNIEIKDNGIGMDEKIKENFSRGVFYNRTKTVNNEIGLFQIYTTLNNFEAKHEIKTTANLGTIFNIYIPKTSPPQWHCSQINLAKYELIIILDNDQHVHKIWENKFSNNIISHKIQIQHFYKYDDLVEFLSTSKDNHNYLFLCDYDLKTPNLNGIDIILNLKIHDSILVTSHANNYEIQQLAHNMQIKLINKEEIPFLIINYEKNNLNNIDMIWVDDQEFYANYIIKKSYSNLKVELYPHPDDLLKKIDGYHKNIRIILDLNYSNTLNNKDGLDYAEIIFNMGYTNLIIVTGDMPDKKIPTYIKLVLKESEDIMKLHLI